MKKFYCLIVLSFFISCVSSNFSGKFEDFGLNSEFYKGLEFHSIDSLRVFDDSMRISEDWLTNKVGKAGIYRSSDNQSLIISNGLVYREILINPEPATISYKNLQTDEELIRSVRPEAELVINGIKLTAGGLKGQKNHAFFKREWIKDLTPLEDGFKFVGFSVGKIVAPFEWKKRSQWISAEVDWPPKGTRLSMQYSLEKASAGNNLFSKREIIFNDKFLGSNIDGWVSNVADSSSSCANEGKAGEILAPEGSFAYISRKVPKKTELIYVKLSSGTNSLIDFGMGISVIKGKKNFHLMLDSSNQKWSFYHNGKFDYFDNFDKTKESEIVFVDSGDSLDLYVGNFGEKLKFCGSYPIPGRFKEIDLGQKSSKGETVSRQTNDNYSRSKISEVLFYSKKMNSNSNLPENLQLTIHYDIYDNLPLISKFFTLQNNGDQAVLLNSFSTEVLALVEGESMVEGSDDFILPKIMVVSDMSFGGMNLKSSQKAVEWGTDPEYLSQVNYELKTPCLLRVRPPIGPHQFIGAGLGFESIRAYEMPYDSTDRERQGLFSRKMFRTATPWVLENPLMMHLRYADENSVKNAVDQAARVGFEIVILTFGSGFNIEDTSSLSIEKWTRLADYAKSKGIALGGYSLLASRNIGPATNVTGVKPTFGNSPCIESSWGRNYFSKLYNFFEKTEFQVFEHDGSYPGDGCRSTFHPGHSGYEDSQWNQWVRIRDFYRWCRGKGIFLNIPDFYYFSGSNKCGMGYREVNWSLPREEQEIIERQNIFDGTWEKTPSMGWMFVPLTEYHGGGEAATIEPLAKHLEHYSQRLFNLLGAGVQACWRGPRLYDTEETFQVVKDAVDFYKSHRAILDSDLIHIKRPDGRGLDYHFNVNPFIDEKGLLMVFNPTDKKITKNLKVPMYYTGIRDSALVINSKKSTETRLKVNNHFELELFLEIEPRETTWFVFMK
ncbi:MAG: hypothetical protein JXR63_07875 [Spirochaetales bacterium]|nr:hypothetical protein [Spirochaetales bacterium]